MKENLFSKLFVRSIACFGLLAAVSNATAAIISLNGTLVGQVTTPIPTGSGSASIIIDTVARTLVFEATYQELNNNVSASHIHAAATATPYVFPTGANWTTALNFSGSPSSTGIGAAPASWGPTTYTPAKVWTWSKENGGKFANINRPIAGATHDKDLPVGRHPLQPADRHRLVLDPAAAAGRLAGPVAGAAQHAGEDVGHPVDHVGIAVAALPDQADVFGHGGVGRAGPLAIDDLVEVSRVGHIGGTHVSGSPAAACPQTTSP